MMVAAKQTVKAAGQKAKKGKNGSGSYHEVRRLLDEQAWYPAHDKRKSTPEYLKIHKELVQKHGCLICGVTKDILDDKKKKLDLKLNPYAANR